MLVRRLAAAPPHVPTCPHPLTHSHPPSPPSCTVFHKACAKYFVVVAVFLHGTAHYYNYAYAPYYNAALRAADPTGALAGLYDGVPFRMAWSPRPLDKDITRISNVFGAGFTGQLLILVMVTIYSGAHDTVKRRHYETFWYTHHFFVLW